MLYLNGEKSFFGVFVCLMRKNPNAKPRSSWIYQACLQLLKNDAYYCYCAHLHISRYLAVVPMGGAYYYRDIFARFITMRRKQNLTSGLVSKEKTVGNHAFFRDN